jgi:hypothetical protein
MLGLVFALGPVRTGALSVTLTIRVHGKNGELIRYVFESRSAEAYQRHSRKLDQPRVAHSGAT